jgi:hypothetical protein
MGIIPFVGSKIGEGMVKGSAFIVAQTGVVLFGIPAVIGGALLTGGAFVFAQSQVLAWGRELVEHPQEEKANTRLARYGAGDKPLRDLKDLFQTFFCGTRADLERWKSFEAT